MKIRYELATLEDCLALEKFFNVWFDADERAVRFEKKNIKMLSLKYF